MNFVNIYVVVNFLSQVIFVFLLFLGMLMYANEVETKGKIKITWHKKLTTTYTFWWSFPWVLLSGFVPFLEQKIQGLSRTHFPFFKDSI